MNQVSANSDEHALDEKFNRELSYQAELFQALFHNLDIKSPHSKNRADRLQKISSACNKLLNALMPINPEEKQYDEGLVTIIENFLWHAKRKSRIKEIEESTNINASIQDVAAALIQLAVSDSITNGGESIAPHPTQSDKADLIDDPSKFFEALTEFNEAISLSIEIISPGRGNSPTRDTESMLRQHFANQFVYAYLEIYGKVPPLTFTGSEYDSFAMFYDLATPQSNESKPDQAVDSKSLEHSYRKAIETFKKKLKTKSEQKVLAQENWLNFEISQNLSPYTPFILSNITPEQPPKPETPQVTN